MSVVTMSDKISRWPRALCPRLKRLAHRRFVDFYLPVCKLHAHREFSMKLCRAVSRCTVHFAYTAEFSIDREARPASLAIRTFVFVGVSFCRRVAKIREILVLRKLCIYSVYGCLFVGRYVRLVSGFFVTVSKYLHDHTTRQMDDHPSKCEDVANAVFLIYTHFTTFRVILLLIYYHGPIARVNPKESNYNIQRIHAESIAK